MKITASNSQILRNIEKDLKEQNIDIELITEEVEGAKGDVATYINIASLGVTTAGTIIAYLSYLQTQKKHYIHYKYKDDANINPKELKFDNLTQAELDEKIKNIQDDFDKLESFAVSK